MVDTTQYTESTYLNVEIVEKSKTRQLVILDEAQPKEVEFNGKKDTRLQCTIEIDGKQKIWMLNVDTIKNLQNISKDSKEWIGRPINLMVVTLHNKKKVIGAPVLSHPPKVTV